MKRDAIKKMLFTIASFAALPLFASSVAPNELTLVEDLPIEQRAAVHRHVLQFLTMNPNEAKNVKFIAIDTQGVVYVLDEKLVDVQSIGAPSCLSVE